MDVRTEERSRSAGVDLEKFVVDYFSSTGAIVEVPSFALVEILLPDDLQGVFDDRSLLRLAFDYEVARENEDAEFVTYGSPVLDRVIRLALREGRFVRRYVGVGRPRIPTRGFERVRERLHFMGCSAPSVDSAVLEEHEYLLVTFRISLESDEKVELLERVLVDRTHAAVDGEFLHHIENAFSSDEPEVVLPHIPGCSVSQALAVAHEEVQRIALRCKKSFEEELETHRRSELARIEEFHRESREQLILRAKQTGETAEEDPVLRQKLEMNEVERRRRIEDIEEKYRVRSHVSPDTAVLYCVPRVRYTLLLRHGSHVLKEDVFYNLVSNQVELHVCPCCGRGHEAVHFTPDGRGVCRECAAGEGA